MGGKVSSPSGLENRAELQGEQQRNELCQGCWE